MLVEAKCITPCWDSNTATRYSPGDGPLPGGLYEIDREGPLAKLKLGSTYVFDFDRNRGPDDKPHDYSCKRPGCEALKPFKTLAELGRHSNMEHRGETIAVSIEDDDEPVDLSDRTCNICDPPKVLKSKNGLRLHNEKSHPFQSQPTKVEAETTVPA